MQDSLSFMSRVISVCQAATVALNSKSNEQIMPYECTQLAVDMWPIFLLCRMMMFSNLYLKAMLPGPSVTGTTLLWLASNRLHFRHLYSIPCMDTMQCELTGCCQDRLHKENFTWGLSNSKCLQGMHQAAME